MRIVNQLMVMHDVLRRLQGETRQARLTKPHYRATAVQCQRGAVSAMQARHRANAEQGGHAVSSQLCRSTTRGLYLGMTF